MKDVITSLNEIWRWTMLLRKPILQYRAIRLFVLCLDYTFQRFSFFLMNIKIIIWSVSNPHFIFIYVLLVNYEKIKNIKNYKNMTV